MDLIAGHHPRTRCHLNLNNASVNMAIWSIPLLAGTLLYRRMSLHFTFLV
jgi:hypothetical protein